MNEKLLKFFLIMEYMLSIAGGIVWYLTKWYYAIPFLIGIAIFLFLYAFGRGNNYDK